MQPNPHPALQDATFTVNWNAKLVSRKTMNMLKASRILHDTPGESAARFLSWSIGGA
jgi:hypothetical protein